jgi:hypothetical protein
MAMEDQKLVEEAAKHAGITAEPAADVAQVLADDRRTAALRRSFERAKEVFGEQDDAERSGLVAFPSVHLFSHH